MTLFYLCKHKLKRYIIMYRVFFNLENQSQIIVNTQDFQPYRINIS